MKKTYVFFFLLFFVSSVHSKGTKDQSTFKKTDIFQTSYFLKNKLGLITQYKGQAIKYFFDHDGVSVFFSDVGPIYKLTSKNDNESETVEEEKTIMTKSSYISLIWIGTNPHPFIEGINKNLGYYTFLSRDSDDKYHSIITEAYSGIIYHDIYPGIDVVYSFPEKGGVKYNFVIHPGANMNLIRMKYDGEVESLIKNPDGNITIHTQNGDLIEHAPSSFSDDGHKIQSSFEIKDNVIYFSLPSGYDSTKSLIIDPWVTVLNTLAVHNLGTTVDYDSIGNLYVYGAGSENCQDNSTYQKVAKYDTNGNFLWVFMGSVPSVNWSTEGTINFISDAKIDRNADKVYMGQAFSVSGSQSVRLTSAGIYDNFITIADTNCHEIWSFIHNCQTGEMLALGGGISSNQDVWIIDPVSGILSGKSFTLQNTVAQDIVCGTFDDYGNFYAILASSTYSPLFNNVIYRVNTSYNGYVWSSPSGYNSFVEINNLPMFGLGYHESSNNFNGLAANSSYLYYYDGEYLKALSLTNGNTVGTPYSIPGQTPLWQGGIAVDLCNHVYVGGIGAIKTFTFDGTSFIPGTDIPLGTGFSSDTVHDIRYNSSNDLLYVTGSQFVGTYMPTFNSNCVGVATTFIASVVLNCHEAVLAMDSANVLTNPTFLYTWKDSAGNILRRTNTTNDFRDTLSGLSAGYYYVTINLNTGCIPLVDTIKFIIPDSVSLTLTNTAICNGESSVLNALPNIPGGSFLWNTGDTMQSLTISPPSTSIYVVTYSTISCGSVTDSAVVTVYPIPQSFLDTTICAGQSFLFNGQLLSVGGVYFDTLSSVHNCDSIIVLKLSLKPISHDTITQSICFGDSFNFGGKFYSITGAYNDTLNSIKGCDSIVTMKLSIRSFSYDTISQSICPADSIFFEGQIYTLPGFYDHTLTGSNGCDSIVTLHLMIRPFSYDTISLSICPGSSLTFGTRTYAASGLYTDTLTDASGCDSIVTLHLSVKPFSHDTIHQGICIGDSIVFNGIAYSSNGTFSDTLTTLNGCDSVTTLNITIYPLPEVTFVQADTLIGSPCFNKLLLNGGSPSGGYYAGNYVSGDSILLPNSPLDTIFTVYYYYTDLRGCTNTATHLLRVVDCDTVMIVPCGDQPLHLYPNPSDGIFELEAPQAIGYTYVIYDILGRLVRQGTVTDGYMIISLVEVASGVYIMILHTPCGDRKIVLSIVK